MCRNHAKVRLGDDYSAGCREEPGMYVSMQVSNVGTCYMMLPSKYIFSSTQRSGNPLDVTIFHFLSWPREGSPPIDSMLKMMGEVENKQRDSKGPLMVMCE